MVAALRGASQAGIAWALGLCVVLTASGAPVPAEAYQWSNVAIGGGGYVTGLVIHPTVPGLMYARTDVGGAYRWNEEARHWEPITESFTVERLHFFGVDGIALDPANPDVVYIAVGFGKDRSGDVLKSTDRGRTWKSTGLKRRFWGNGAYRSVGECLQVDPTNSRVVYCGTRQEGLWRSDDAGGNWRKVDGIPDDPKGYGVRSLAFGPRSDSGRSGRVVYASVKERGVFRSDDGGKTFSLMPGSPADPNSLRTSPDGEILYATATDGVHRWQGREWKQIGPEPGRAYAGLAVDPRDGRRLVCAGQYRSGKPEFENDPTPRSPFNIPVFMSEDGGATWRDLTRQKTKRTNIGWLPDDHFSAATGALNFDPHAPGRLWLTDWYGVWQAEDVNAGTVSWVSAFDGIELTVVFRVLSLPTGPRLLTGLGDNDGMTYTDVTAYPTHKHGRPELQETTGLDYCATQPQIVARVGSRGWGKVGAGGISHDGGLTWEPFSGWPADAIGYRCAISADDPDNIVAVPLASVPIFTRDGGRTFAKAKGAPSGAVPAFWNQSHPIASDRMDGARFYLCTPGGFWRSEDRGANWTRVNADGLPYSRYAFCTVAALPGVAGEVWVSLRGPVGQPLDGPSNWGEGLYRSRDGGQTFARVESVLRIINFGFGKGVPGRTEPSLYVHANVEGTVGLFRSDDLGSSWVRINDDAHALAQARYIAGDMQQHGRVYLGTGGRGVYYGEPRH